MELATRPEDPNANGYTTILALFGVGVVWVLGVGPYMYTNACVVIIFCLFVLLFLFVLIVVALFFLFYICKAYTSLFHSPGGMQLKMGGTRLVRRFAPAGRAASRSRCTDNAYSEQSEHPLRC